MTATEEYERVWDMLVELHRRIHGESHVPKMDFNCCDEYGVMMALRAASTVKTDYPAYLLMRIAAMPPLDQESYVKDILATDGESEPADPEALREYRASRRYHVLWSELKTAAAKVDRLERELEDAQLEIARLRAKIPATVEE